MKGMEGKGKGRERKGIGICVLTFYPMHASVVIYN
jgi:hypothetical protein